MGTVKKMSEQVRSGLEERLPKLRKTRFSSFRVLLCITLMILNRLIQWVGAHSALLLTTTNPQHTC